MQQPEIQPVETTVIELPETIADSVVTDQNRVELTQAIERIAGLEGYGVPVVDATLNLFARTGVEPTCENVAGMVANAVDIVHETKLDNYNRITNPTPLDNLFLAATVETLHTIGVEVQRQSVETSISLQGESRTAAIDQYWEKRGGTKHKDTTQNSNRNDYINKRRND